MALNLKLKTFLVVTGASRGIGKELAEHLAVELRDDSFVLLMARSKDGLLSTKASIEAMAAACGKTLHVQTSCIDLSKATASHFEKLLHESLECGGTASSYERAIIIHNAGTVGNVAHCATDCSNVEEWKNYYQTNLFSTVALNCEFFKTFEAIPKLVVNISSKCAIEPFSSMSYYCSGKAARDMYFRVLALERKDVKVLNYAPGCIETDMTAYVQKHTICTELAEAFKHQRDTKTMLTTKQTALKFIQILERNKYESGDHVDYWD